MLMRRRGRIEHQPFDWLRKAKSVIGTRGAFCSMLKSSERTPKGIRGKSRAAGQNTICKPSSTTRFDGILKKAVALLAFRNMAIKTNLRQ